MTFTEVVRSALHGLMANRLRSLLTTLGISIGVASVILLVAVGAGAGDVIQQSIRDLGTNAISVLPRFFVLGANPENAPIDQRDLTLDDVEALSDPRNAPDVLTVSPIVQLPVTLTYRDNTHTLQDFSGSTPSYFSVTNSALSAGAFWTESDVDSARRVVALGATPIEELFGGANPIGERIEISGVPFTVVAVLESRGSLGFVDADDTAVAPITAVQQSLSGYGPLTAITVQARSEEAVPFAEQQVVSVLDARHDIDDPERRDYQIFNQASLLEATGTATTTISIMLAAVAGISLLVGGIGIMNIMLVSVTERTREIGIRKAVGAPRRAILAQFLAEATFLSVLGGTVGVVVGLLGTSVEFAGINPRPVLASIIGSFMVSVAIGLFFGSYPAARAASLRPIEALRYE
jgi:putative ABC transport system permease protein